MTLAHPRLLSLLGLLLMVPMLGAAVDSIAVTDHTVVGFKSNPTLKYPDTFIITLEVEYALKSKPKALLKLAVDKDAEMSFSAVDEKEISAGKKKRKIEVTARLVGFSRSMLRGVVMLQDPEAPPGAAPLAMTGVSLDMKKFREG